MQLATSDSANSALFRYDEVHELWNTVVGASYADGYIYAELPNFSIYGVFSALRASVPTAQPAPGSYYPGRAVSLVGDSIYFTTDGSEPNRDSEIYNGLNRPILGQDGLIMNAINLTANHRPSKTVQFYYGIDATDVRFTAVASGGEFFSLSFRDFKGTWFRPDSTEIGENPEAAYDYYRTVGVSDWQEDNPMDMGRLEKNDTLLIQTSEGRFVKDFIIDTRGHFNHSDRPAVDFVYQFTDEIDMEPPVLEQITVITVDGQQVSQPLSNSIAFELTSEPKFLVLNFNEIVYRNRGLMLEQEDSPFPRSVWWSYADPQYYLRPSLATQFRNQWTELPFEEITINFEVERD